MIGAFLHVPPTRVTKRHAKLRLLKICTMQRAFLTKQFETGKTSKVLNFFYSGRKMIRELPRKKRLLLLISPLVLVGLVDSVRAYQKGDVRELMIVCAIFFIIVPLLQIGWDLHKYK